MNLLDKNTARPAVRNMAEVKNCFGVFSVFNFEVSGCSAKFICGAKIFVDFGGFLDDVEFFWGFFSGI